MEEVIKNVILPEGASELTIRQGEALPQKDEPIGFTITGNINSPKRFYDTKKDVDIYKDLWPESHVIADPENGKITLVINEQRPSRAILIEGEIKTNPFLDALGINKGKPYTSKLLSETIRRNRLLFESAESNMEIVAAYAKFKAKVDTEIEQSDDNHGNRRDLIEQKLATDMPQKFVLKCPIHQGEEAKVFEVDIFSHVHDNKVVFTLDSVALHELSIMETDRIITAQLVPFKTNNITIIYK
jgi:hypothetical protein